MTVAELSEREMSQLRMHSMIAAYVRARAIERKKSAPKRMAVGAGLVIAGSAVAVATAGAGLALAGGASAVAAEVGAIAGVEIAAAELTAAFLVAGGAAGAAGGETGLVVLLYFLSPGPRHRDARTCSELSA
jgi:hypothetical protein